MLIFFLKKKNRTLFFLNKRVRHGLLKSVRKEFFGKGIGFFLVVLLIERA